MITMSVMDFGTWMRQAIQEAGLTRSEFTTRLSELTGSNEARSVSFYWRNQRTPRIDKCQLIAAVLNVDVDKVLHAAGYLGDGEDPVNLHGVTPSGSSMTIAARAEEESTHVAAMLARLDPEVLTLGNGTRLDDPLTPDELTRLTGDPTTRLIMRVVSRLVLEFAAEIDERHNETPPPFPPEDPLADD